MNFCKHIILFLFIACCVNITKAQEKPIGYWNSFLPYNTAYGVATDGVNLFVISKHAYFEYKNPLSGALVPFSKANGMSDIGMQCIAYDMATSSTVLIYSNGNIDIFKDNTFYNIPDLKLKIITGDKTIYQLYIENSIAYLSTSIGVILIDLHKFNIQETYQFIVNAQIIPVTGFIGLGDYFYAISKNGMYSAKKSTPDLQNFEVWRHIDSTDAYNSIAVNNNKLYLSSATNLYCYDTTMKSVYISNSTITHIDAGLSNLFISENNATTYNGFIKKLDINNSIIDSIMFYGFPKQVTQCTDGSIWVADANNGLEKWTNNNMYPYMPPGPSDINSVDIYANNGNVWVAHGGYDDIFRPINNGKGISNFHDNGWQLYQDWVYGPFLDTLADFVSIVKDESDGTVYAGSFGSFGHGGLFALKPDGSYQIYKQSVFDRGTSSGGWQVSGLKLDNNNNLWVTMYTSLHELYVREKSTGNWYKYQVNITRNPSYDGGSLAIDDYGQAWYVCIYGGGLMAYSTNGTFSDVTDDTYCHFTTGVGFGNLPSNNTFCVVNDKSGNIWVGTDNGIGIFYQPSTCIKDKCDATIPIVQYDQYAGYLFAGENVRSIAVDGADRKWVGTDNGLWLLTHDAGKIIYHFTQDNSPLPSNHIQKITIDKVTGDVYFGTDQGMVSYRSTATEGGDTNHNVMSFPNPVPAGYTGSIAIKGLVANADVRITDINGQLVFHTTAFGGQAIWSGLDYKGHRPQSGVYLIFITNTDNSQSGTQTYVGKLVFLQ